VSTRTLNRAVIIGNVGEEPKLNYTGNGSPVCTYRVATNRTWNPSGSNEKQESTQWHSIVTFGKFAEVSQRIIHKSQKVYVDGRLKSTDFENDDGSTTTKVEIVAQKMIILDDKQPEYTANDYQDDYDDFSDDDYSPTTPSYWINHR